MDEPVEELRPRIAAAEKLKDGVLFDLAEGHGLDQVRMPVKA